MAPRIFRPVHPDLELPHVDLATDVLSNHYIIPPDTVSFIDAYKQSYTFAMVIQRTKSLAHDLRNLGVRQRDVVAFFSPNTICYALVCFAVIGCGAVFSPISAALTASELHDQLETSQARYIVVDSALFHTARMAAEGTSIQHIIQADGSAKFDRNDTAHMMATHCTPSDLFVTSPTDTAPCLLCFSMGTTRKAKGTLISHFNMTSNMRQMNKHRQRDSTAVAMPQIAFLPMSHIYGLANYVCASLRRGGMLVVMRQFSVDAYLSCV
ncbi:hypothetical protein B0A55_03725 [Friedmanniomyces simplex]|uniref:AMP-dependent synthetase/ligase domain-containing protein n=1 Tax=Friedmanniomyces simplex TaxID=329884 RepID=A0A4V5NH12_9PEZI|nr:hypothetical protein B0A55_05469 [Friedmanniomyces simplex]TKA76349.1 hypothetical protein B0A55_03725 [Friedmanniomyces simplex]